jgi:hypothetical protein
MLNLHVHGAVLRDGRAIHVGGDALQPFRPRAIALKPVHSLVGFFLAAIGGHRGESVEFFGKGHVVISFRCSRSVGA